ncbi:LmeA family phospholipid-binding protein [Nocardia otitidiscaviarum]|uniref:LmeA family phospholipid-binding protein n=1 Tax=Nocardia otitidiscaviarum TaxID=1823 RepID=UPI000A929DB2
MSSKPTSDDAAERDTGAPHASDPDATLVGGTGNEVSHEPGTALPDPTAEHRPEAPGGDHATELLGTGETAHNARPAHAPDAPGVDDTTRALGDRESVSDSAPTEVLGANPTAGSNDTTKAFPGRVSVSDSAPTEVLGNSADAAYPQHAETGGAQNPADHHTEVLGSTGGPYPSDRQDTTALGPYGTETFDAAALAAGAAPGGEQQPPTTPPPPVGPNAAGSGEGSSRMRGRTLLVVALVVSLLAIAALAGGEAYARRTVENCITSQFEQEMGSRIDVSFGAKPMLITMFDGKVSSVTVNSDDTKFGPAVGMVVHAKFNDIEVVDNGRGGGTIGSSSADVTWSNDGIAKTLGGLVSGVQSDPTKDTLTFAVLGGLAGLEVKPQVVGNKVEVTTEAASLLGFGLPTDLVEGIVDLMAESLQSYPMGLQPTEVQVTDSGLRVLLAGGKTELPAAQGDSSDFRC